MLNSRDHDHFFSHIKKLISPSNNSIKLRINDTETDDPVFVSDALNKSFARNFSSNIHTPPDIIANQIPSFIGFPLSFADIRQALMLTKPSKSSLGNLPGLFLSKMAFSLTYPVYRIFVSLLSNSCFPVAWKLAHILPIFTGKGLRSDVKNYRPVSLTPVLSKVLEHIVKDKLLAYISANHLHNPYQHGFVSKRSVVSNFLISDSIFTKLLDRNIPVDTILFDFSKAFDRVPHSLLLHRLKLLGIGGSFLSCLSDFFPTIFNMFLLEII